MRPRIGLVGGTAATIELVTSAAAVLGADTIPTMSDSPPCDLWLIDATCDGTLFSDVCETQGEAPRFLLAAEEMADQTVLTQTGVHGIVRVFALMVDLEHALRFAVATAAAPARPVTPSPWLERAELCYRLPNDLDVSYRWAAELRREAVERVRCPAGMALRLASAACEAVLNAMLRGNLEISPALANAGDASMVAALVEARRRQSPYRDRRVWASSRFSRDEIRIVVRDEGPGFPSVTEIPTSLRGRGRFVLRSFCDEFRYNDDGTEVTLLVFPSGGES